VATAGGADLGQLRAELVDGDLQLADRGARGAGDPAKPWPTARGAPRARQGPRRHARGRRQRRPSPRWPPPAAPTLASCAPSSSTSTCSSPIAAPAVPAIVLRGVDVRSWSLVRRKRALSKLLATPIDHVLFVQDIPGKVRWLYAQAVVLKLEGVVAKRLDSPYQDGVRSADWVKIKRPGAVPAQRFKR
jgi:hypothetical protein